jgi:hypothetical protein
MCIKKIAEKMQLKHTDLTFFYADRQVMRAKVFVFREFNRQIVSQKTHVSAD